ncbi:phage antirepressor KilAC domain-containing protein [Paraclostridium sordellii]|uniref:phage antirepressor KilAC domain-containing protein n=1 Tax=Paraclostridium sordellii TaxID=1505 RepID=UPI0005E23EDB|nr:phage antirepressor KilAC domain-containing protein [Paeniclostridium sordellii]CEQ26776.1 phage protein [[Clostridium] sordellii] [Paeniclostridium sordellii]
MKRDLEVQGKTKILGIEVPVIHGGFGNNQKVMLAKTISEIHDVRVGDVNDLINSNIDEFEFGVDIIDLKNSTDTNVSLLELGFSKQSISNSKNIYLLSEQGYMTLVMLMRTNKAKEIRKQIRKQYFAMIEVINSDENLKKELAYKLMTGGIDSIEAHKQLVALETRPLIEKIEKDKDKVEFAKAIEVSDDVIDFGQMAKILSTAGFKIGRNNLTELLRTKGALIKDQCILMADMYEWNGKTYTNKNHNVPYQNYIDRGYFKTRQYVLNNKIKFKVLITPKGQQWLIKLFKQRELTKTA